MSNCGGVCVFFKFSTAGGINQKFEKVPTCKVLFVKSTSVLIFRQNYRKKILRFKSHKGRKVISGRK